MEGSKQGQKLNPASGKVLSVSSQQRGSSTKYRTSLVSHWSPSVKQDPQVAAEMVVLSVDEDAELAGAVTSIVKIPGNQHLRLTLLPFVCVQEEPAVLELAKQCPGIEVDRWAGVFMVDDQVEKQAGGCAFFCPPYDDPKIGLVWMESSWSESEIPVIEGFVRESLVPLLLRQVQQACEPDGQRFYTRRSA